MPDPMHLDRCAVVRVPFPFTDRDATRNRPALVLSDGPTFNAPAGHVVLAMITSAAQHPWPLDHAIANLGAAGLRVPSKVRFKLFTLDQRLVRNVLGTLAEEDRLAVGEALGRLLGGGA